MSTEKLLDRNDTAQALAKGAHATTISVNRAPVNMPDDRSTGLEIKQAAIEQGVKIDLNFQLLLEHGNGHGKPKVIGDNEPVHLKEGASFVAIAPDDNS